MLIHLLCYIFYIVFSNNSFNSFMGHSRQPVGGKSQFVHALIKAQPAVAGTVKQATYLVMNNLAQAAGIISDNGQASEHSLYCDHAKWLIPGRHQHNICKRE